MKEGFHPYYVYSYPRYFVFDKCALPSDFSENNDYWWDENTSRLVLEDGTYYSFKHEESDVLPMRQDFIDISSSYRYIPWPCDAEIIGRDYRGIYYEKFPTSIENEHNEINAVIKYLLFAENEGYKKSGYTIEKILDFQLDEQKEPQEFLEFLISGVNGYPLKSIVWLRLKDKIVKWHDEKKKELDGLLNPASINTDYPTTVEEIELTPIEITAVAHKVVLFHELGIINPLKKLCLNKNPTLSDTQFAELVGGMMGFEGKKLGTVRKALISYGQGKGGDVKSNAAMKEVKSKLMRFGIEL